MVSFDMKELTVIRDALRTEISGLKGSIEFWEEKGRQDMVTYLASQITKTEAILRKAYEN